jgi:hypothetical protein
VATEPQKFSAATTWITLPSAAAPEAAPAPEPVEGVDEVEQALTVAARATAAAPSASLAGRRRSGRRDGAGALMAGTPWC